MVLIKDNASAPPACAALADSFISVTFGLNFIIIGFLLTFLTAAVICSMVDGDWPNAIPPSFTLGQEILISNKSAFESCNFSTASQYSSVVFPTTFTIILVSCCSKKGKSRFKNTFTPGFCNPMAFNIPLAVSHIRGVGFPSQGVDATPLVMTPPSALKSTNSLYSSPDPKVPDAVTIGLRNSTPAIFTHVFITISPHLQERQVPLCIFSYCEHWYARLSKSFYTHRQGKRRFHKPFFLPWKYSKECDAVVHIL